MQSTDSKARIFRDRIREAAATLFQEKGYKATSMRELAQAVGLEASSLYNYIRSKDELLSEICMESSRHFMEGMDHLLCHETDCLGKLKATIRLHIDIASSDPASVTVFNDEWKHLNEADKQEFLHRRKKYENQVLQILQSGMQQGEIRQMDPKIVLYSFLTSLKWIHHWFRPGKINPDILAGQMEIMLLQGLARESVKG